MWSNFSNIPWCRVQMHRNIILPLSQEKHVEYFPLLLEYLTLARLRVLA
jgi:hypothetical protein